MKRTLLQMYILGSADAVPFYTLAFSEAPADMQPGTGMQFCLQFHESEAERVSAAYSVLKEGAQIVCPLGSCVYNPHMFSHRQLRRLLVCYSLTSKTEVAPECPSAAGQKP